jgi:NADPH:quinone reductase-like Zn-dependent oxidoreductase
MLRRQSDVKQSAECLKSLTGKCNLKKCSKLIIQMQNKETIVVIGASGDIGKAIIARLLKDTR